MSFFGRKNKKKFFVRFTLTPSHVYNNLLMFSVLNV